MGAGAAAVVAVVVVVVVVVVVIVVVVVVVVVAVAGVVVGVGVGVLLLLVAAVVAGISECLRFIADPGSFVSVQSLGVDSCRHPFLPKLFHNTYGLRYP